MPSSSAARTMPPARTLVSVSGALSMHAVEGVQLPPRLLRDPKMIEACRARDFAVVFSLVRRAGIYPSRIARLCDMTPSRVGEIVAGRRSLTHMATIERVADGLRIPGHMLGLAARPWETQPSSTLAV